jgi:hypothetical protein
MSSSRSQPSADAQERSPRFIDPVEEGRAKLRADCAALEAELVKNHGYTPGKWLPIWDTTGGPEINPINGRKR